MQTFLSVDYSVGSLINMNIYAQLNWNAGELSANRKVCSMRVLLEHTICGINSDAHS